jgi:hypothetical protein
MNAVQLAFISSLALLSLLTVESTPYYPIEVSRMLAQSHGATLLFATIMSFPLAFGYVTQTNGALISIGGVVVIGIADDVNYFIIHMIGVCIIGAGMLLRSWELNNFMPVLLCAVIWSARLVVKLATVYLFEEATDDIWNILRLAQRIMLNGGANSRWTMGAFRLAGLGQWLVFWIAASMF